MYSKGGEYYVTPNYDLAIQRTDADTILVLNKDANTPLEN